MRGSLQQMYPKLEARGMSNCKLRMTEVEGIMIREIHLLTMVHEPSWLAALKTRRKNQNSYIYYTAWVGSSASGIAFLNFKSTEASVVLCCCFLTRKRSVSSTLRSPKDTRNISAVKAESEP